MPIGACYPMSPAPGQRIHPVRAALSEFIKDPNLPVPPLSTEDYELVPAEIYVEMGPGETAKSSVLYPVTREWKMLIYEIRGVVALLDWENEYKDFTNGGDATKGIGSFATNPDVAGRALLKAMNARVTLTNTDTKQSLMKENPITLASILPGAHGGMPLDYRDKPHVVREGHNLQLRVELAGSNAKLLGGTTRYGLLLNTIYLKVNG